MDWRNFSATRLLASTFSFLVGFGGIEHGIFEILQGNVAPNGLIIDAIGPAQEFWEGATEPAFTIIPNFLITGILAIIVGLFLTIWAIFFIHRKNGPWILLLLSGLLFLFGGGSGPLFHGILAVIIATRINKPLNWWRKHLSVNVRGFFTKLWPWILIIYIFTSLLSIEIAIIGWPFTLFLDTNSMITFLYIFGFFMYLPLLLAIFSGISFDIQAHGDSH